jgi:signal transduction histidine kinase
MPDLASEGLPAPPVRSWRPAYLIDATIGLFYAVFFIGYTFVLLGRDALDLPWFHRQIPGATLVIDPRIELLSWVSIILVLVCAGGLVIRRSRPRASFLIIVAGGAVQIALSEPIAFWDVAMPASLFSAAAYGDRRFGRAALAAAGIGYVGIWVRATDLTSRLDVLPRILDELTTARGASFVALFGLLVLIWSLGDQVRAARERFELEREHALRMERERAARSRLGALEERHQIARELHDVVAHGLSVVVVQADGALYAAEGHPEAPMQALRTIATTAREAMAEMRHLLGVLRDSQDGVARAPQPMIAAIPDLVESFRSAGLPVEVVTEGSARPVSPPVSLAAYRVVQESLTNVLKHAGAPAVRVRIEYEPTGLLVEVVNERGDRPAPEDAEPGLGLTGMRERVSLLRGSLATARTPEGGWRITARIPSREHLAAAAP